MERLSLLTLLLLEAQVGREEWGARLSSQVPVTTPQGHGQAVGHPDMGRLLTPHSLLHSHPLDTSPLPATTLGAPHIKQG